MSFHPLKILLIGHGKMGKAIEETALGRGHSIAAVVSESHSDIGSICRSFRPDVAFEFTSPAAAAANLEAVVTAGVPVICGSTGWLSDWDRLSALTEETGGTLFYSANFSIGMNLMFALTELAARWMDVLPEYEIGLSEIHHTEKQDRPSGTALHLAGLLTGHIGRKKSWKLDSKSSGSVIGVEAMRLPQVPGTHEVRFESEADTIQLIHTAHSRRGFALGAVLAAEWLRGKKGVLGMHDFLADRLKKIKPE
jgi:4-hydroxy-tetrahydrodipicolinate reductase